MQKIILLLAFSAFSVSVFSQKLDLLNYEAERGKITKKSMMVLGGWSAANIITSAFATKTHNTEMRYFHQMNVQWNSINLFFAALGYLGAGKEDFGKPVTLASVLKHQGGTEKTYMLNIGLDAAYIATGLYLTERSKSRLNPAKLKGYGNDIMFQGGFLLLFDGVNYLLHHNHAKKLNKLLENVQLNGGPGAMSLVYRF